MDKNKHPNKLISIGLSLVMLLLAVGAQIGYAAGPALMQDLRDEIVMVGDRNYDCIGAAKAGIDCIGVTYGFGSRAELEAEWPACIVDSPIELRNVLIGQAGSRMNGTGGSSFGGEKSTKVTGYGIKPSVMPEDGGIFRCIFNCVVPVAFAYIVSSVLYVAIIWGMQMFLPRVEFDNMLLVVMTGVVDFILIPFLYMLYRRDEIKRKAHGRTERILNPNAFGAAAVLVVCEDAGTVLPVLIVK